MADNVSTGVGAGAATARDTAVDLNYRLVEDGKVEDALGQMTKGDLIKMIRGAPNTLFYQHRTTGQLVAGWNGVKPDFDAG